MPPLLAPWVSWGTTAVAPWGPGVPLIGVLGYLSSPPPAPWGVLEYPAGVLGYGPLGVLGYLPPIAPWGT